MSLLNAMQHFTNLSYLLVRMLFKIFKHIFAIHIVENPDYARVYYLVYEIKLHAIQAQSMIENASMNNTTLNVVPDGPKMIRSIQIYMIFLNSQPITSICYVWILQVYNSVISTVNYSQ